MADRLNGKVAIVTGAGGVPGPGLGIGKAISITLAREGASVLLVDVVEENAKATLSEIEDTPGKGVVFVGDVSKPEDCEAMVAAAVENFGGLDILVNNAAISRHFSVVDTEEELFDRVIGINLKGAFMACKYAVPALIERGGGSIVQIGSIAGIRDSGTSHPAYTSSKAGMLGMMADLAGEYGRDNIRVNAVLPGIISTPMQDSVGRIGDDVWSRLNLLGRPGSAWDIANAVLFLCSDEGSYLTSVTLPVDGGATMAMAGSWNRKDRREQQSKEAGS